MADEQQILDMDDPAAKEALEIYEKNFGAPQYDSIMDTGQKQGVYMSILSAVRDLKKEYRQTLRTASYQDPKQSRMAAGAINECERLGADITPILNITEAQNGERGPHGVRSQVIEGMSHFNLTTGGYRNLQKKGGGHDKSKPI